MTLEGNEPSQQGDISCRVSVTGISYLQAWRADSSESQRSRSLVSHVAQAALSDDGYSDQSSPSDNASVIVCDHFASSKTVPGDIHKFSAHQLAVELNLPKHTTVYDEQISNPLQGFAIAADRLHSGSDVVLLVINDNDLAVFVLRRLKEALLQGKHIYASIVLLEKLGKNDDILALEAKYHQADISPKYVHLLTLASKSSDLTLKSQVMQFTQLFSQNNKKVDQTAVAKSSRHKDAWCSLRMISNLEEAVHHNISPIVEVLLSLQQKVFLPVISEDIIQQIDLNKSPFYFNIALRPWFHPQVHAQFGQAHPQLGSTPNLRRAALHIVEEDGTTYHMVAEECEDIDEAKRKNLQPDWPSELFTFFAADHFQLADYLQCVEDYLNTSISIPSLKDLAFTINARSAKLIDQSLHTDKNMDQSGYTKGVPVRVAFVCSNGEEFLNKVQILFRHCKNSHLSAEHSGVLTENQDIYWGSHSLNADDQDHKLAFVLPGLGAAYPNMLLQLCLHFPEIRAIFDYVDALSVSTDSQSKPSDRIFSRLDPRTKAVRETPASLAVMDSAVISVLMAEWAIFTLFLNMGIIPDALLGCSTGEFAALTMSGAVDILKAAPLFFHLSTGMVRALPFDQLVNLRSLKVTAAIENIKDELDGLAGKIHLSANLSPRQLILTGDKESINALAKSFESKDIPADFLPFAIPYHTPLVSEMVSLTNPDIQALQITNPLIASWSCSLAALYPAQPEEIRKMMTNLFSKPILFRESVEALYRQGIRTFVEVGPRGSLAPVISETLNDRPHTSLAANRADISAITQIHHVLAALFTSGVYMDLGYLYARRSPVRLSIDESIDFDVLTESFAEQESAKPVSIFNPSAQKQFSLKNVHGEIATINQTIVALSESFHTQLEQLESQVMSYLSQQRVDSNGHNGKHSKCLSQEIDLKQVFTDLSDDLCTAIVCQRVLVDALPSDEKELSSLAHSSLITSEVTIFASFRQLSKRKEWLAGRIAAKEAAVSLVLKLSGKTINCKDIPIDCLPSGKPYLNSINETYNHLISITHKDGTVMAVAADRSKVASLGIDLESLNLEDNLEDLILNSAERQYIRHVSNQERIYYIKAIWSAKEAAAKSLGLGLSDCLTKLTMAGEVYGKSKFSIHLNDFKGEKKEQFINAHVSLLDNMVIALVA